MKKFLSIVRSGLLMVFCLSQVPLAALPVTTEPALSLTIKDGVSKIFGRARKFVERNEVVFSFLAFVGVVCTLEMVHRSFVSRRKLRLERERYQKFLKSVEWCGGPTIIDADGDIFYDCRSEQPNR